MNGSSQRPAQSTARIFLWPGVLACVTLAGLLAALLGDGLWDACSWLCLGALPLTLAAGLGISARTAAGRTPPSR